jgi:hypothetical protein
MALTLSLMVNSSRGNTAEKLSRATSTREVASEASLSSTAENLYR